MANKFTEKQEKFIAAKAAGMGQLAAMLAAGYARNGAPEGASKLIARPEIKKAIAAARKKLNKGQSVASDAVDAGANTLGKLERAMQREHYADPRHFLEDVVNNPLLPVAMRAKAAETLMPYTHGRIGEKGKKDGKKDAAHETAKGRFKAKEPPKLASVSNIR